MHVWVMGISPSGTVSLRRRRGARASRVTCCDRSDAFMVSSPEAALGPQLFEQASFRLGAPKSAPPVTLHCDHEPDSLVRLDRDFLEVNERLFSQEHLLMNLHN